jgi:hypothetical protein
MKIRWSSLFSGSFAPHFQIKVEHTGLKFQLQICNYEWAKILFVEGGLDSKLRHWGPCKLSWKNSKTSHLDCTGHNEGDIMQNHVQQEKVKKVKNQDSMGKTNFFLSTMSFSLCAIWSTWLHVGAPQKIQEKWT